MFHTIGSLLSVYRCLASVSRVSDDNYCIPTTELIWVCNRDADWGRWARAPCFYMLSFTTGKTILQTAKLERHAPRYFPSYPFWG